MSPTLMLLWCVCMCVTVCISSMCVSKWVELLSWWRLIFLDLERSSKCPLPAFFSVCLLSSAHSPTRLQLSVTCSVNHHLIGLKLISLFFSISPMMIICACLKACPSPFCQANPKFVCAICLFSFFLHSFLDQLVCSYDCTSFNPSLKCYATPHGNNLIACVISHWMMSLQLSHVINWPSPLWLEILLWLRGFCIITACKWKFISLFWCKLDDCKTFA